mgnify:CR=1 FL=1
MSQAHASAIETIPTGIPSGKLGMWLFLASEVMFFTALIAAYVVLKMGHPNWPGAEGHLNVVLGTINTFVLICSSTTIVLSMAAAQDGKLPAVRRWLGVTVLLGSAFLTIKAFEYAAKFSHHIVPSTNVFWSCYYTMTGLHALHVIGGIVLNLWILSLTFSRKTWAHRSHMLELGGLYWHFVDIVWIFLFPLLYLLQ